ncbi:Protein of unknown function [Bacillus wiedmannii]|uniref:Uncharacterized protein n=1 Tax=Bacillus wiedmannii TaxID=1890302 RepID=A0A1C4AKH8_9BACI|nr:Protein of unknown function [Bacillus wiedmannii]
MKMTVLRIW